MTGERENEIRELMLRLPIGDARKAISHLLLEVEDERAKLATLCARLREAIRVARNLVNAPEPDLFVHSSKVRNILTELIERLGADL